MPAWSICSPFISVTISPTSSHSKVLLLQKHQTGIDLQSLNGKDDKCFDFGSAHIRAVVQQLMG